MGLSYSSELMYILYNSERNQIRAKGCKYLTKAPMRCLKILNLSTIQIIKAGIKSGLKEFIIFQKKSGRICNDCFLVLK
jgi:hypothetical protein